MAMSSVQWTSGSGGTGYITTSTPWINIAPNTTTTTPYTWINEMQYGEHECGIHDLRYKSVRPGCPLCAAEREIDELQIDNKKLRNQADLTRRKLDDLEKAWDFTIAMKEAAELLNDDDMEFLKKVLYLWRDQKNVALKVTFTYADKKRKGATKSANGFIVMTRGEEPWGYACTSIGGLAIAAYFAEAVGARGPIQAMAILTRALSDHLPGSLDEPGHSAA